MFNSNKKLSIIKTSKINFTEILLLLAYVSVAFLLHSFKIHCINRHLATNTSMSTNALFIYFIFIYKISFLESFFYNSTIHCFSQADTFYLIKHANKHTNTACQHGNTQADTHTLALSYEHTLIKRVYRGINDLIVGHYVKNKGRTQINTIIFACIYI